MAPALVDSAIVKRNVAEDWGKSLQRWVQDRPPAAVFVIAIVLAFLMALVVLSLVWETIRKVRASYQSSVNRQRAEWIQLPDGSSVLTHGRVPDAREVRQGSFAPGAYLGPMTSLIREARQDPLVFQGQRGQATAPPGRHVPFEGNAPVPIRQALYDPPVPRSLPIQNIARQDSVASDQTKVETGHDEKVEPDRASPPDGSPSLLAAARTAAIPSIPPPPRPNPTTAPAAVSTNTVSPPRTRPVGLGHTRQASSGGFQPKGLQLGNSTSVGGSSSNPLAGAGEDRFSTPKPTPVPTSTPLATTMRNSIMSASASLWSASTLAPSPAPTDASKQTFVSSIFAPRVDLKRTGTWSSSLSSWFPGYSDKDEETKGGGDEEETAKLVDRALKDAR
ncbi:hypothetical protein JCM3766R1_002308 [Sporobolomyces carnicolor]